MKEQECTELLEVTGDKCPHCKEGKFKIVCDIWSDGEKYYYLKCNKCGVPFDG